MNNKIGREEEEQVQYDKNLTYIWRRIMNDLAEAINGEKMSTRIWNEINYVRCSTQ